MIVEVRKCECPLKGRGLFLPLDQPSEDAVPPGTVLLREIPYAWVLNETSREKRCDQCMQSLGLEPSRCSACKFVYYCGARCQKLAWTKAGVHKHECNAIQKLMPRTVPSTIRLVGRILLKTHKEGHMALPNTVQTLGNHWEELSDARRQEFAEMAVLTGKYIENASLDASKLYSPRDVAHLLAALSLNGHTIANAELKSLGTGLYTQFGAYINHSCTPNAAVSFDGSILVIRSLRPIQKGEEVTISYTDLAAPRWERRMILREQYVFDIDGSASSTATLPTPSTIDICVGGEEEQEGEGESGTSTIHFYESTCPPWPSHDDRDVSLTEVKSGGGSGGMYVNCGGDAENNNSIVHVWSSSTELHPKIQEMAKAYISSQQCLNRSSSVGELMDALGAIHFLGNSHILRFKLLNALLNAHIESGEDWKGALSTSRSLLPLYEKLSPAGCHDYWAPLALHLATVAKLQHLEEGPSAIHMARRAAHALQVCQGQCPPVEVMNFIVSQCEEELN